MEHGLYDPFARENLEGNSIRKYIPQSPRNCIMYFLSTSQQTGNFHLIKHYLQKDSASSTNPVIDISDEYVPRLKRKRKQTFHSVSVTQHAVFDQVGAYLNEELNCANQSRTLYNIFEEQLVCEGTIRWRQHNENEDICLMNDINATTGYMIPGSFVHVTCTRSESSSDIYLTCTCQIYDLIQRAAQHETPISTGEYVIPNEDDMYALPLLQGAFTRSI